MKRLQFEAITLAAVCAELQEMIGGKLQAIRQPNENTIALEVHRHGLTRQIILSCHAEFFRAYVTSMRVPNAGSPPQFCSILRASLIGTNLDRVQMLASDRVLELTFGDWRVIAELMGKHSNIILVNHNGTVMGAAQWVGRSKSSRPIQPNQPYHRPPVLRNLPDIDDFRTPPATILPRQQVPDTSRWVPGYSLTLGPYPFDLGQTISDWRVTESISKAIEDFYVIEIQRREVEAKRSWLLAQVERVILAREVALSSLAEARDSGGRAATWQRWGELLLAYQHELHDGCDQAALTDYDGTAVKIKLDPEQSIKDNALRYFDRAKRAKGRLGFVLEQIQRIEADLEKLLECQEVIQNAKSLDHLISIEEDVRKKRWMHEQPVSKGGVAERPYDGHKIREVLGPNNYKILYGETAEANDYLTLRVAKGNDYWLHVRGHTSAHVIVQTQNHPEKVGREVLLAAAKIAVQHSNQKHAGYVPVDFTLKKYVRKPKSAPKGTAHYVNEKTLHVEG